MPLKYSLELCLFLGQKNKIEILTMRPFTINLLIASLCFQLFTSCNSDRLSFDDIQPNFIEDYYDWESEKVVNFQGEYRIKIDTSNRQIIFDESHGRLLSALSYENSLEQFNFNGIYKITDAGNNHFYFRFGWVTYDNMTRFSNVHWIDKKIPDFKNDNFEEVKISTVDIEFVQKGYIRVCTVGDSQSWWMQSSKLRKKMNIEYPELIFVGSNTDIYGYPHEAEGGDTTWKVINRFDFIPKADYYTILLGTNDYWQKNVNGAYTNLITLISKLNQKYPDSKIIYITPIPAVNKDRDRFNLNLQEKMEEYVSKNSNVFIANLGSSFRSDIDWSIDYIDSDGLHLTEAGVNFMAKYLSNYIFENFNSLEN